MLSRALIVLAFFACTLSANAFRINAFRRGVVVKKSHAMLMSTLSDAKASITGTILSNILIVMLLYH